MSRSNFKEDSEGRNSRFNKMQTIDQTDRRSQNRDILQDDDNNKN